MNLLDEDIYNAKKLIEGDIPSTYTEGSPIYGFTTEYLRGYLDRFDLNKKCVLTVTGSGDHALNMIFYGAKRVVCFDINRLTKYYLELKRAVILNLNREDFVNFFHPNSAIFLSSFTLDMVSGSLSEDVRKFWEEVLKEPDKIRNTLLKNYYNDILKHNPYLDEDKYYLTRESLGKASIEYIDCDIKDLDGELMMRRATFDYMFFSNIYEWRTEVFPIDADKKFKEMVTRLERFINYGGFIVMIYKSNYFKFFPKGIDLYTDGSVIDIYDREEDGHPKKHTDALIYYYK